jgi:hypothetical protein
LFPWHCLPPVTSATLPSRLNMRLKSFNSDMMINLQFG